MTGFFFETRNSSAHLFPRARVAQGISGVASGLMGNDGRQ
jgi:hypothetical protein